MPPVFAAIGAAFSAAAAAVSGAAASLGLAGGGAGLLGGLGGKLLGIAVSLGLSVVIGLLGQPPAIKPSDSQRIVRQAVPYRRKLYGVNLSGGALLSQRVEPDTDFFGDGDGHLVYWLVAVCDRRTAEIRGYWLDGKKLDVDGSGDAEKKDADGGVIIPRGYLKFRTRLGTDDQVAFPELVDRFDMIDETWRGLGTTLLLALALSGAKIYERLPNGSNSNFSLEGLYGFVWDPRDPAQSPTDRRTWAANPNAALVILDHLTGPASENGYEIPVDMFSEENICAEADRADTVMVAPLGGTRRMWELHGEVPYNQSPSQALTQMLACCDARLVPAPEGKFGLSLGGWREPTVTLTDDDIVSIQRTRGGYRGDRKTVIKSQYTSPAHGYQETDAIEYVHQSVEIYGRNPTSVDFLWANDHGQCRHLQKITAARLNARDKFVVETNQGGAQARGERFLWLKSRGLHMSVEITSELERILDEAGYLAGYRFSAVSMTAPDIDYDELVDGVPPPPVPPDDADAGLIPSVPTLDVEIVRRPGPTGGIGRVVARATLSGTSTAYYHRVEYRETGTDDPWLAVDLDVGDLEADIGGLLDGGSYDFRAQARSASGESDWSPIVMRTITYDPTAPGAPTNVVGTGGVGKATIDCRAPSSANAAYVAIYRSLTNYANGTLIERVGALRKAAVNFVDEPLAPGTYRYYLRAGNASGVESPPTAAQTGNVHVT